MATFPRPRCRFHRGHQTLAMPDLDRLSMEAQINLFADQPRTDRVGVLGGPDGREPRYLHALPAEVLDPHRRELLHPAKVLAEQVPPLVPSSEDLPQERFVAGTICELARSTNEQRLLD